MEEFFTQDYTYNIYEVGFPSLENRLEDSLILVNTDSIGTVRYVKSLNKYTITIVDTQKSRLDTPEWTGDILVCQMDLSPYFDGYIAEKRDYIIKRFKNEN